jgi:predicted DNA-binding ribbon-helix-helix protein
MKSSVVKRSVIIGGHKTSVSLEEPFWDGLKDIATWRGLPLSALLREIDSGRANANLSSAIRVFVLEHFRAHAPRREGGCVAQTYISDEERTIC